MPKYNREMEEKIVALFEQGKRNSVISRELSIDRGALPRRRKEWEKGKQAQGKPETETEKPVQQEQNDSHPLDPQIYTLIRYQGTQSREEALSQAIETQNAFNPYVLNHKLKTPKELIQYFENKSQLDLTKVKDLKSDLDIEIRVSRGLVLNLIEENAKLGELAEQRYEEGLEEGREENAIWVRCAYCNKPYQVTPLSETHGEITKSLLDLGWGHAACVRRDEYNRGAGSRALTAEINRY